MASGGLFQEPAQLIGFLSLIRCNCHRCNILLFSLSIFMDDGIKVAVGAKINIILSMNVGHPPNKSVHFQRT